MTQHLRKNVDAAVRGWLHRASSKLSYPIVDVVVDVCLGCCECLRRDIVQVTVRENSVLGKRGFFITMTAELAKRTSGAFIAEQIVKALKERDDLKAGEYEPLVGIDIWEENNRRWDVIEAAA